MLTKTSVKIDTDIDEWISDYVPDKEEAAGLSGLIRHKVHKYGKRMFATGLILGAIFIIIIILWVA